jgi:TonB family protein
MNRLQRKCLFTSAALHGLLLLVLLLSSAFLDRKPEPFNLPLLPFIPAHLIDAELYGGGDPAAQPVPTPPQEQPPPAPKPQPAEPPPVRPQPKPEPRVEPKPSKTPEVKVTEPRPAPPREKPKITVQTKTKSVTPPERSKDSEEKRREEDALKELRSAANRLKNQLTTRTDIKVPGPGGEAFANYSQAVISIYQQAWMKPAGIERGEVVKATVTIARSGRVLSARITRLSGNRVVDDSVERVLQRVKEVRPFPQEAKDETRTFELSFELVPADLTG